MAQAKMPLPDWSQYKVVPESVLETYLHNFYRNFDFYRFMFDCQDHAINVIKMARPKMNDKQVEDFDLDCYLGCAFN